MRKDTQRYAMIGEWKDRHVKRAFAGRLLQRWQHPHATPAPGGLLQQNSSLFSSKGVGLDEMMRARSRFLYRKRFRIGRPAESFHRTDCATRLRPTNQCAQIHQRRIKNTDCSFWNQSRSGTPKSLAPGRRIDWRIDVE